MQPLLISNSFVSKLQIKVNRNFIFIKIELETYGILRQLALRRLSNIVNSISN